MSVPFFFLEKVCMVVIDSVGLVMCTASELVLLFFLIMGQITACLVKEEEMQENTPHLKRPKCLLPTYVQEPTGDTTCL
jgi:hypothetical protein